MIRKLWQRRTSSFLLFAILALLGIIAFFLSDSRIAGMYFVALVLLFVAEWRYRKHVRASSEARRVPTEIERP